MMGLGWLLNANVLLFLGHGLGLTAAIALISEAIAFVLGALLALGRLSPRPFIHYPSMLYIETLRSLPLLLIVFFVFFAISPMLRLDMSPFAAGVVALSSFNAAVIAEIVRAGIQSVNTGIIQAAESQALSARQVFLMIQLPLALRRMTPALVTQFIANLKSTTLLVVVGVEELLGRGVIITNSPPYQPVPVYALLAVTYFAVNYALSLAGGYSESRMAAEGIRRA